MSTAISVYGQDVGAIRLTVVADFFLARGKLLLELLDLLGLVLRSDLPLRGLGGLRVC